MVNKGAKETNENYKCDLKKLTIARVILIGQRNLRSYS